MKPSGPIPPGFAWRNGELHIAGRSARAWVETAGDTPCFVYDRALVDARIAALRAAHPAGLDLHYAIKANPYTPLLSHVLGQVDGLLYGRTGATVVDTREDLLETTDDLERSSLDPYSTYRSAYRQRRRAQIENRTGSDLPSGFGTGFGVAPGEPPGPGRR